MEFKIQKDNFIYNPFKAFLIKGGINYQVSNKNGIQGKYDRFKDILRKEKRK